MNSEQPGEMAALDQRISELRAAIRRDQRMFADAAEGLGGSERATVVTAFEVTRRVEDELQHEGITDDLDGSVSARLAMLYAVAVARLQDLDP